MERRGKGRGDRKEEGVEKVRVDSFKGKEKEEEKEGGRRERKEEGEEKEEREDFGGGRSRQPCCQARNRILKGQRDAWEGFEAWH